MVTWIKPYAGNSETSSGAYNANFLFKKDKFYIMDNHLCATWCWLQEVNLNNNHNYFHIDRHYDWLDNKPEFKKYVTDRKIEIDKISFTDYLNLVNEEMNRNNSGFIYKLFRYDNYLPLCFRLYPNLFKKNYFATHDDGSKPKELEHIYEPQIHDLFGNISYWITDENANKSADGWIFNLDIDYFFQDHGDEKPFQMLSDDYVLKVSEQLKKSLDKIKVVTIAMSPEFCGGWENSYRITKLISDYFNLDFSLQFDSKN